MLTCIVIFGIALLLMASCMAILLVKVVRMENAAAADMEFARQKKEFQEILAKEEKQFQALMNYRGGLDEEQE